MTPSSEQSNRQRIAHLLQEFRTVQRGLTCVSPNWVEGAWAEKRAFEDLPRELLLGPGKKWFRSCQDDRINYCEYDPDTGGGRHHRSLPSNVDRTQVIDLESKTGRALLDRLGAIVTEVRALGEDAARLETLLHNVTQLYDPGTARDRLLDVMRYDYFEALVSHGREKPDAPDRFLAWLDESAKLAPSLRMEAKIDGIEMAAVLLIREVARHLIDDFQQQPIALQLFLYERLLFSPVTPSVPDTLQALAGRMMRLAMAMAQGRTLFNALEFLQQEGEALIEDALNGTVPLSLDLPDGEVFYEGLCLASPRMFAAHIGFMFFSNNLPAFNLSEEQKTKLPYEANNVEEKMVRIVNSLELAIENIDRKQFYTDATFLAGLIAQGRLDELDARLLDLIDNQYLYPRSLREVFRH